MERTDQQNCGTCRYSALPSGLEDPASFDESGKTPRGWLTCRYNPPVIGNGPDVFPQVTKKSWCGRYEYEDPTEPHRHRPAA